MNKPGYSDQGFWVRMIYMLVYWFLLNISLTVFGFLLLLITIIRFGSQYSPNGLIDFQFKVTKFITQTLDFLTFKTEEKPYPFQPWPKAEQHHE